MSFEAVVSFGAGMFGLAFGTLGMVAGPSALSIVLGALVAAVGIATVWLGWTLFREEPVGRQRIPMPDRSQARAERLRP